MKYEEINIKTDNYFEEMIEKYGTTVSGVGWNGESAQRIRYEQLAKVLNFKEEKIAICDYGCGWGYFLEYLKNIVPDNVQCSYIGMDLSNAMIQSAIEKYGENTEQHTFINSTEFKGVYDYIVASGVFSLKLDISEEKWKKYILDTINEFNLHSKRGFAFNALTKYSDRDKMRDEFYYSDPTFLFDYCKKNFSRNVALLHDYELYDFTILVRK